MMWFRLWQQGRELVAGGSAHSDLSRATRGTLAIITPLLLGAFGWLPLSIPFVAFAAQNVAIVDVRGSYTLRLGLLLAMTAILAGAASLGGLVADHLVLAILAGGLVAACGGLWRHLTPDYGAPLAISSVLVFVIAVNTPAAPGLAGDHGFAALVGGGWGLLLQIANWPIRPQHPLRRAVSDSWVAVADLFEALAPPDSTRRTALIQQRESTLRTTLDHTYAALVPHNSKRVTPLGPKLGELNLAAARLATRVVALNTALETVMARPDTAWRSESFQPVLTALTNLSRSAAIAVVSRQPGHLAFFEVRLRRVRNLLRAYQERTHARLGDPAAAAPLRDILRQIEAHLPAIHDALRATIDRADERAAFSLELLDLHTWTLRPLAAALNFNRRIDPALLRFSARIALLTMAGVAAFKLFELPHGYWLPLTMVIVLQPDFGSTRQRAAQRTLGTLAGSVAASLLLWLQLPFAALATATATTIFAFGFFLKRNYAVAVFFITLVVVLLTEGHEAVTWRFTAERLGSTVAGGALALLAALFFWPVWERDRLPPILAAALEGNCFYLAALASRFAEGAAYDTSAIAAKRRAESANSAVFSSLQRMMGDPRNQQEGLENLAALANGNQRVTRALTVLAMHLTPGLPLRSPEIARGLALAGETLRVLTAVARGAAVATEVAQVSAALREFDFAAGTRDDSRAVWVSGQMSRVATELGAMLLAAEQVLPAPAATIATPTGRAPVVPL